MIPAHLQEIKTRSNHGILLEMTGKQQGEKHSDLSEAQETSRPSDPEEVREEVMLSSMATQTSVGCNEVVREESRKVYRARFVLLLVLLTSAIGVALGVFYYIRLSEHNAFRDHFEDSAYKVLEAIGSILDDTFGAIDILAVGMVAHAKGTNQEWPFVTVPHFGLSASKMLSLSKMKMIASLPVVTPEIREAWEDWVDQDLALMETDPNYHGPIVYE